MSHIEQGSYKGKHKDNRELDEKISQAIKEKAKDKRISCAAGSNIAEKLGIPIEEVGRNADLLEIKVDKCQIGLFGYVSTKGKKRIMEPAETVSKELEAAVRSSLEDGKLPCLKAWDIADEQGVSRMAVCAAADALGIKSSRCQLGAF